MSLFSIFSGRSKHSGTQADTRSVQERLWDAEARLARLKELPESAFTQYGRFGVETHGVDGKPKAIAYCKAEIAELRVRLSQQDTRSPQTPTKGHQKNATSAPPKQERK